jgi:type II secretory pathway component PulM
VTSADRYVLAAYVVVLVTLLVYLLIMTLKLSRLEREARELAERAGADAEERRARERVPVG